MTKERPESYDDIGRFAGIDPATVAYSKSFPADKEAVFTALKQDNDELASFAVELPLKLAPRNLKERERIFTALMEFAGVLQRQDEVDRIEANYGAPSAIPEQRDAES